MRKAGEALKRHPYRSGIAALAATVLAAEITGYARNPLSDIPENACVSPPAISRSYASDANVYLQAYTGINTPGVIARGIVPEGAYGIQASFKAPEDSTAAFTENASRMIEATDTGAFALKMAVGNGPVQFATRLIAPEGSSLCTNAPYISYDYVDSSTYAGTAGTLPWQNPANTVVNLF